MLDGIDDGDENGESFPEHEVLDEKYQEPDQQQLRPDIPTAPDTTGRDIDPVVEGTFWTLVVVFNVGLLVVSVGVLFVIFQENQRLGWQLAAAGAVVLGYGVYRYRSAKQLIDERVTDGDGDAAGSDNHNE
ncbi:DUF7322 domain-containing protein [Salinibaculum salinum]|uniref:DUF7322 domain-containing protein n=1 Tax=Salinibaculum salinum TaxID=3131996 RepID=UPI0030EC4BC8